MPYYIQKQIHLYGTMLQEGLCATKSVPNNSFCLTYKASTYMILILFITHSVCIQSVTVVSLVNIRN